MDTKEISISTKYRRTQRRKKQRRCVDPSCTAHRHSATVPQVSGPFPKENVELDKECGDREQALSTNYDLGDSIELSPSRTDEGKNMERTCSSHSQCTLNPLKRVCLKNDGTECDNSTELSESFDFGCSIDMSSSESDEGESTDNSSSSHSQCTLNPLKRVCLKNDGTECDNSTELSESFDFGCSIDMSSSESDEGESIDNLSSSQLQCMLQPAKEVCVTHHYVESGTQAQEYPSYEDFEISLSAQNCPGTSRRPTEKQPSFTQSCSQPEMDAVSDSDLDDDIIMYHLEEEPQEDPGNLQNDMQVQPIIDLNRHERGLPPDMDPHPDDPEIPNNEDDNDGGDNDGGDGGDDDDNDDDDDDDEDNDDDETFSFDEPSLNTQLRFGQHGCTLREALLLNIATSVKHHWTYESLVDSLTSYGTALGRGGVFPTSKKLLWRLIKKSDAGLVKYTYCPNCHKDLGKYSELVADVINCDCNARTPRAKMPFFVSLSLKKQLKHFLGTPGIGRLLQYRNVRRKHRENSMEDIFDGEVYEELLQNGTLSPNDFTYTFNTDGFVLFKIMSVWGLLVRLNDLPPNIRQRHLFLAAVWLDKKEPTMSTFMKPFVRQANNLSREGIVWQPDGAEEVCSKFHPVCCCVDALARAKVMNQHQFNGAYGCFLCTHAGIELDGSMKYPNLPFQDLPPAVERTQQSIRDAMLLNELFEGQKGPAEVMFLNSFDMGKGNAMDDLHPFYEGVASFHMDLLEGVMGGNAQVAFGIADVRMKNVRTPVQMARKWLSIKKRSSWKGSQWGYFIRYHVVLCFLENNLPVRHLEHVAMLSYSLFIFSQDSIDPEDFERASRYVERYLHEFEQFHGPQNMRFNVHMLQHVAQARRRWGPSWTVSTFNFESWNHQLGKSVTSPKGAVDQIVNRHFLKVFVHTAVNRNDISERVRNQISHLLFASERKLAAQVEPDVLALGRAVRVMATAEEEELLRRAGYIGRNLLLYERVLFEGIEFRCSDYHVNTRSDNSVAYTWDNTFVTIRKIAVLEQNGENVCGMFVEKHVVRYPVRFAEHIAQIIRSENAFVRANSLRIPAIKMTVRENNYVVPMASCREID